MKKITFTIITSLLVLILAACGSSAVQTAPEPDPATEAVSQPTEVPATEAPATEAPAVEVQTTEAVSTEAATSTSISYAAQIQPIFDNKCIKCHGIESVKEGLDMRTYDAVMAGSFNGAVIIPGDSVNSFALQQIADGEMPKRGPKVTPEELQLIIDWVNQGAQNN